MNDNQSKFQIFVLGYWNQMADEIYENFGAALADFSLTEGRQSHKKLISELEALHAVGRFPPLADVRRAYSDPFWQNYDRIIVEEDLRNSGVISPADSNVR